MIDVHCHVIPKIDDGSDSFEESYLMFEKAKQVGFTDLIATSHYMEEYYTADQIKRDAWIQAMNRVIQDKKLEIKIHLGNEIYISQNMIKLVKEKQASTLAKSNYLLFELPMNTNVTYLNEIIFELKAIGLYPIIAHPERYSFVQADPNSLIELIEKGVLFQANYASILGYYGNHAKQTVKKLLKANMIHFLGSDAHNHHMYEKIPEAMIQLEKLIGEEKLERLTKTNPLHILEKKELEITTPEKIKKGLFH